ncbi:MAG: hypothetical protein IT463_12910 [Planctomycetes bacterium]|nr:hypothetical protein [Planctomycetota bacterium]
MAFSHTFGEGTSDYEKYIRTQDLYRLQKTPDQWANEEELLFQVIHQAMELWLKVVIQHCEQSTQWIAQENLHEAARFLGRSAGILRWLADSLEFPRSMAPWDYHKIRMGLGQGSGQESPTYKALHKAVPPIGAAFAGLLKKHSLTADQVHQDRTRHQGMYDLMFAMVQFDQELMHWKYRHFQLVKRIIGDAVMSLKGVPASSLKDTCHEAQFPDLWTVINRTTGAYNEKFRPKGGGGYAATK